MFDDLTDAELIAQCRAGRQAAWSTLVRRFQRLVYTVPRRAGLSDAQAADVTAVLASLGLEEGSGPPVLEVWNKIDALEAADRVAIEGEAERRHDVIAISALTGDGIEALRELMARTLRGEGEVRSIDVAAADGGRLAWLHARGDILRQEIDGDVMRLDVRLSADDWQRFQSL